MPLATSKSKSSEMSTLKVQQRRLPLQTESSRGQGWLLHCVLAHGLSLALNSLPRWVSRTKEMINLAEPYNSPLSTFL